ncbi:MAG: class I adenylate-forming enzyme family protein [bacterium]|nr:class I adenylate-forming enzyme family protein [bacterium]
MHHDPRNEPARSLRGINAENIVYPHLSWGDAMRVRETSSAHAPWMTYIAPSGRQTFDRTTFTYADFIVSARKLATLLANNGVARGSRVAIADHNHPDTILAYFACWLLGACAVPLNMSEDDARLTYILNDSNACCILCRSEYIGRVSGLAPSATNIVDVDTDSATSAHQAHVAQLAPHAYPEADDDMRFEECLVVYTSGTTGNPKGVVLIQQNLFADGYDIASWHGIDESTRMMCVLPVHHVNGTIVTHVAPFLAGASVVLNRKFSASHFFDIVRAEGVHIVSVVPTLLAFLLEANANGQGAVEGGFRHIICGAGPLTCDLASRFEEHYGIPIVHGYGLSETTCYTCFLPRTLSWTEHQRWMQEFGYPSIGVPLGCNEMAIHTPEGIAVTDGERGEIVSRGPNVMKEYYGNPSATHEAFLHGWFRTGDEGFAMRDENGNKYFFITGRIKELIIRGGVNLAPLEIDEVIARAPGVRAGIAVGFDNDVYGEEVGALVIPRDTESSADAILAYCREHLPFHKAPKVVLFTDVLPVTSTGKYQRNKVKSLFAEFQSVQYRA